MSSLDSTLLFLSRISTPSTETETVVVWRHVLKGHTASLLCFGCCTCSRKLQFPPTTHTVRVQHKPAYHREVILEAVLWKQHAVPRSVVCCKSCSFHRNNEFKNIYTYGSISLSLWSQLGADCVNRPRSGHCQQCEQPYSFMSYSINYLLCLWLPARTERQPTLRALVAARKQSRACLPQLGPARPGLLWLGTISKSVSLSLTLPSRAKLPHWQAGEAWTKDWPLKKSHYPDFQKA